MPITYLDEKPKSKVTYLNSESPNRGERSLIGNIFERPQKAIGGGIISQMTGGTFGEGYKRGAILPEEIPTFESVGKGASNILGLISPELREKGEGGVTPLEMVGQGLDVATNPAQWLLTLMGVK